MKKYTKTILPGKVAICRDHDPTRTGTVFDFRGRWYLVPGTDAKLIEDALLFTTHGHKGVWRVVLDFGHFAACHRAGFDVEQHGDVFVLDARVKRVGSYADPVPLAIKKGRKVA